MGLLIKVNNIPQIRQITKSLPQDILKQAVADEKPVLSHLWNTPVFSNKDGMFSVENVNREFILSNTGALQDANGRVLAYLDNSKAGFPFEAWYKQLKPASFKSYCGLQIFLSNLCREPLGHIDVYFLAGKIPANIFLEGKPWRFIQYKDENGKLETPVSSSAKLKGILSDFRGRGNISLWGRTETSSQEASTKKSKSIAKAPQNIED